MYAQPDGIELHRARRSALWLGTTVVLILTLGMALLGRAGLEARAGVTAMAAVAAFGTFIVGWLCARVNPYPRWAWNASAGIMASAILVSAAVVEPAAWRDDVRQVAWMLPWLLLTTGVLPGAKRGACAPAHPRAGWIMVVGTLLVSSFLLGLLPIVNALRGR